MVGSYGHHGEVVPWRGEKRIGEVRRREEMRGEEQSPRKEKKVSVKRERRGEERRGYLGVVRFPNTTQVSEELWYSST